MYIDIDIDVDIDIDINMYTYTHVTGHAVLSFAVCVMSVTSSSFRVAAPLQTTVAIVMSCGSAQATLIIEGLADEINDGLYQTDQLDDNLLANLE